MNESKALVIQNLIYEIRGQKVMLDRDLAELYGVELKAMNQAVKRNIERFPYDFMFQLAQEELDILRSQIVTANISTKIRFLPYVFTEQGIAMLSSVLSSPRAIEVNISIMRAFVKMRHFVTINEAEQVKFPEINEQIAELRKLLLLYIEKNDKRVNDIVVALNNLIEKPRETKRIGFCPGD